MFSFAPALCSGDLKLLEMPPHLADSLAEGEMLTLRFLKVVKLFLSCSDSNCGFCVHIKIIHFQRGDSDDGAVLCTQNATFSVKEAETSNSLLVVPSLVLPTALEKHGDRSLARSTVEGVFYKYLEVLPTQPTIKRLHTVLREKSYKGGGSDQEHGMTLSELLETVQASEEEILQGEHSPGLPKCIDKRRAPGLKSCEAVRVDGEWFSLDPTFHMKVVGFIFRW